jgi:GT2 family glycosyltransferase
MAKSLVSVVVLNYNGAHLLSDCLESLLAQNDSNQEILVVDNASIDNSKDVVHQYACVQWIGLQINGGLGPGYNAGAREAKGDKLFFVNNDMRFAPDCILRLTEAFQDAEILAADPLQMDWEGKRVIHGAHRFQMGWRHLSYGVPFMALVPGHLAPNDRRTEAPFGCAGAIMFDREKFEALGGFDPTFFLDYEDLDICWRGWLRGWKTLFIPEARLYHKVGESEDSKLRRNNPVLARPDAPRINERRLFSQLKNSQRFVMKTMSWPFIVVSVVIEMGKVLVGMVCARPKSSYLRLKAMATNLGELREILKERRKIMMNASVSSRALKQRFAKLRNEDLTHQ